MTLREALATMTDAEREDWAHLHAETTGRMLNDVPPIPGTWEWTPEQVEEARRRAWVAVQIVWASLDGGTGRG